MFDTLVIELQKDGKAVGSVAIDAKDLNGMNGNFSVTRAQIIEDIIQTIEEGLKLRQLESSTEE
jgi:hypothetical protein